MKMTAIRSDCFGANGLTDVAMRNCPLRGIFIGDGWYDLGTSTVLAVVDGDLLRWWQWFGKQEPRSVFHQALMLDVRYVATDGIGNQSNRPNDTARAAEQTAGS